MSNLLPLCVFVDMLINHEICYKNSKIIVFPNSCNLYGYALELAVKHYFGLPLDISRDNNIDVIAEIDGKRHFLEVKTGSSPCVSLRADGSEKNELKTCSFFGYAIYIDPNKTLAGQFGYILPSSIIRKTGFETGFLRETVRSDGKPTIKTQTLYNYKKNDYHGTKAFKLSALWEENGAIPFKEFFK